MTAKGIPEGTGERGQILALFNQLVSSTLHQFPLSRNSLDAPSGHGVYVIYASDGLALHVGKSSRGRQGLRQRLVNHLAGQSSFVNLYFVGDRTQLRNGCCFRYLEIENPRLRALLEAYAIGYLCPAHIGLNDKLKVSLDATEPAQGLRP